MLSCCFIGHRNIDVTDALVNRIKEVVSTLLDNGVEIFYFGSRSQFNNLCYDVVTEFKQDFPNIQRAYIRAEYQYISKNYNDYLLQFYEDTFYPSQVAGCGKIAYVKRNQLMIDASDYCVFYYNPGYTLSVKKLNCYLPTKVAHSGTKLSYDYAVYQNKKIVNICENLNGITE